MALGANLANMGITNKAMLAVSSSVDAGLPTNLSVTTYTLKPSDAGRTLRFTAAGAVTVTVPQDSAAASFPIGQEVMIISGGAGGVTISASGSAVINGSTGAIAQYGVRHLRKTAANLYIEW